jgi:hypothetical protein
MVQPLAEGCENPLAMILQSAQRFAAALDAEDYEGVRATLAADCVYHAPEGLQIGPDEIVKSYRQNGASARDRFEKIEYESRVEAIGPTDALITFIDRVTLRGAWHEFRCRQRIRIGAGGLVEQIWHEEIPGERERLRQFEAGAAGRITPLSASGG